MQISIPTQRSFNVKRTMISHGWSDLVPFEFDQKTWTLTRVVDLDNAIPVSVKITGTKRELRIDASSRLTKAAEQKIIADVRHMFRLDDDMSPFYRAMSADPDFEWIAREGAGRMLRSPTVFEDLVKMICTTNCSWALTDKMVTGLVNELGRESAAGRKSFPPAAAMAEKPETFFRAQIRAGYRAPYL